MSFLDRNTSTPLRVQRNSQRLRAGDLTSSIKLGPPLVLTNGAITLNVLSTGGLFISSNALAVKLADTSLQTTASGLSVKEADTSLTVSSGLKVNLADTSLTTASGVKVNLATNPGLTVSSGLKLLLADTSLSLAVGGVAANLNTTGGLQTSTGLGIKLADSSLQTTSSGESVALMSNGGLQVSSGLGILLDDTSGLVTLLDVDFTILTNGTQVGAIGGSGVTWFAAANSFQPTIPDNTQVNSAVTIQAFSGFANVAAANTAANAAQAQYVPTLAIGSSYTITMNMVPIGPSGGGITFGSGIFVRGDKAGHSASQGIAVEVFTDLIRIIDNNGGGTLGSIAISPALSATTAYDLVLVVNGNSFSATINGFNTSGSSSNNAANLGVGFWIGRFGTSPQGVRHFKVQAAGTPTNSGLQLSATGLSVKATDGSIGTDMSGVFVRQDFSNEWTVDQHFDANVDIVGTIVQAGQFVPRLLYVNIADSTALNNSVTATNLDVNYTFPGGYWSAGRAVRIRAMLDYSTTGTPTLTPNLQIGGVTIAGFSFAPVSAVSGARLMFDATIVCRTTGASGTFGRSIDFAFEIGSSGQELVGPDGGSAITVNTTSTTLLAVNFQWGTANVLNTVKLHQLEVFAMN